jgi:hypothetical protein
VCSTKCRTRRSRRRKLGLPSTVKPQFSPEQMRKMAEEGAVEMAKEIMRDELKPVVREALSRDVLSAISDLVSLTPLMVSALKEELTGAPMRDPETGQKILVNGEPVIGIDPERRLRAVQLLARYTVGSAGLAPQPESKPQPIAVNFGSAPRPDWDGTAERECDVCNLPRQEAEFIGDSSRCTYCQQEIEERARSIVEEG